MAAGATAESSLRSAASVLVELGFLRDVSVDHVVARALRDGAVDEEDAAYHLLVGNAPHARRFVAFDHHLDPDLVEEIDAALEGEEVRVALRSQVPGEHLVVELSNASTHEVLRTVEVHSIDELIDEVDRELAETRTFDGPNTNRQAFWLACHEGSALLFATDAEAEALVNAGVPSDR